MEAPTTVIGLVMAFGSGVLISAVAFELAEDAFTAAGTWPLVGGVAAGAVAWAAKAPRSTRRGCLAQVL